MAVLQPERDSASPWTTYTLYLALLTPILIPIIYAIYQLLLSPLAGIPGPLLAPLSRLWMTQHSVAGDMHRTMIALHAKHGDLVRTGPGELSVSDLAAIKTIYGAGTRFRKSNWYSVWQGRRKFDLFPERDERVHAAQRRLVSSIYAMGSLREYEDRVDEALAAFIARVDGIGSVRVDFAKWLQLFAFDVIGGITFSRRFGFIEKGDDGGMFVKIEAALRSASWVGQVPWVYWLNDYVTPYIGNRLGIANRHGYIRQFTSNEVTARRSTRKLGDRDILEKLFQVHDSKPTELDDENVLSMATSNVMAGSDTTAISLRAIFYFLLRNPDCKAKLVREIDEHAQAGTLSYPVTLDQANQMPYLQACMYEALRLHPAVGMSLPRVTPPGGIEIAGRFIPPGTVIGANPWVVHRNADVFGDDVEAFRPERWIGNGSDKDAERIADMHRFFFAFGAGARMCLGRNISWMEMSKLVPTLLGQFEVEFAEGGGQWRETCWWFVKQDGFDVTLSRRKSYVLAVSVGSVELKS